MKKLLMLFLAIALTGCTDLSNTPKKRVEEFLHNYQTLDSAVISDLDETISKDNSLSVTQADTYKGIMKKHYQNLTYEIKEDKIDGDNATVTVLITVTDFKKVLDEVNSYMNSNVTEFYDENGIYSMAKYNDYRLQKLSEAKDKVKYTIYLNLFKENDEWKITNISKDTYDKINGVYNY